MRPRLTGFLRSLCLLLAFALAQSAFSQIHQADPKPDAEVRPHDSSITVTLALCVQGGTNADPCPADPSTFYTYVPNITYTYGQVLNGLVIDVPQQSTGTFTLTANGVLFCTLPLATRTACPPNSTNFDAGTYVLYAYYNPPGGGPSVQSLPVNVTVLQDTVGTLTLTSSGSPSSFGAPVTFTAQVLGQYAEPATGIVNFTDGTNPIGAGNLDATGIATVTTSTLAVGTHTIHASYPGSIDIAASSMDATYPQTVLPPATTTSLVSSLNPSVFGENVTFTATVLAQPGVVPTGAVSFDDGTKAFGTIVVSAQGKAQTTISTLAEGSHNITANYSGDAATGPSVSPVLVQQVNYPLTQAGVGYKIVVNPSPVVLGVGLIANLTVTVTPTGGFSQPVTLTCGDLPHESTCTFGETVIPAGGGSTTLDLHVTSPHDCGSSTPYFYGANRPGPGLLLYGGPALAGLLMVFLPRRRRWHKRLLALCACIGLAGMSGCSSTCTDFGTYPGSYTFQVIGTAPSATTGTPLVVPVSVGLTVKI